VLRKYGWIVLVLCAALACGWLCWPDTSSRNDVAVSASPHQGNSAVGASAVAPTTVPTSGKSAAIPARMSPGSAPPLPPSGTPLKQIFDELKARADAGDAAAASRLYRDLSTCFAAAATMRSNTLNANALLEHPDSSVPAAIQQQQLDRAQELLKGTDRLKTLCAGVDQSLLGSLAATTLQAAQLGDASARDCYVHRGPFVNPHGMVDDPASLGVYRQQAPVLIDSAIASGDWKMVDMLQYAYGPSGGNLIAGLVGLDPVQHYRYLKLYRLGASGNRIPALDRQLAYAANQLDAQQRADADAWAAATQQSYFHGSSTDAAPQNWNACAIPSE
jgi:hypothetical protein